MSPDLVRKKYIARFLQLNPNQLSWNFSHWQSKWHLNTFCVRQVDIFYTFGFRGNSKLAAEKSIFSNRFALFALKFLKSKPKKKNSTGRKQQMIYWTFFYVRTKFQNHSVDGVRYREFWIHFLVLILAAFLRPKIPNAPRYLKRHNSVNFQPILIK